MRRSRGDAVLTNAGLCFGLDQHSDSLLASLSASTRAEVLKFCEGWVVDARAPRLTGWSR